jgi:cobalt-zinc-cadmium efflux system membrane fusion protein
MTPDIFFKSASMVVRRHGRGRHVGLGGTVVLVLLAASSACSRGPASEKEPAAGADARDTTASDSMKGVAGMDMAGDKQSAPASREVTLRAGQIRHGGVAWQPVTMGTAAAVVTVPGQLVPNEDRTARLGATAGGRVVTVRLRPGNHVARGQVLVTLQSPEAGAAQSDIAKSRAELDSRKAEAVYATSARDRAERLLALKAIPRQDYERAVTDDEHARHAVAQAEAELTRARTFGEQLGAASSASGEIAIRAPLAGVVLARMAVPGTVVDAGAPLAVVTDPTSLWLTINAPEALAGAFRTGAILRFSVPAYQGQTFSARIDAVGAGLDPGTRTLPVRATIDNRDGRLKPEMLATVMASGGAPVPAVILPDAAVQSSKGKTVVFIARPQPNGDVKMTAREVEVASRGDGQTAITRGLAAGDMVVTKGAFAVKAEIERATAPKMEM